MVGLGAESPFEVRPTGNVVKAYLRACIAHTTKCVPIERQIKRLREGAGNQFNLIIPALLFSHERQRHRHDGIDRPSRISIELNKPSSHLLRQGAIRPVLEFKDGFCDRRGVTSIGADTQRMAPRSETPVGLMPKTATPAPAHP